METRDDKPAPLQHKPYPEPIYPQPLGPSSRLYEGTGETTHLREYWNILAARRLSIIAIAATVLLYFVFTTFRETPIYQATVTIQIERDSPKIISVDQIYDFRFEGRGQEDLQTQLGVLMSSAVAERVIKTLHLDQQPANVAAEKRPFSVRRLLRSVQQAITDGLASVLSPPQKQTPGKSETAEKDAEMDSLVEGYLASLTVEPIERTSNVKVIVESPDPELAAKIVNAHADAYKEQNLALRIEATKEASDFLKRELVTMKANLEKAEEALQSYGQRNRILFLEDGKNTETTKLASLQGALTTAQMERIQKESNSQNLLKQGGVLAEATLAKLSELRREDARLAATFLPDYSKRKELRNQITEIEQGLSKDKKDAIDRAEAEYRAALDRERLLQQEVDKQRETVEHINGDVVHYDILKREADSSRQLYDSLLKRVQEAGISSSLRASNIYIIDRAKVPRAPVWPDRGQSIYRGLVLGLILGIGFAFFRNYMDSTLKSPGDVHRYLGLATLAIIPQMGNGRGRPRYAAASLIAVKTDLSDMPRGVELVTQQMPSSLLSEAYRSLRTSLILSRPDNPPQTVLIASAVPGEGKTSTATNLAISLSQVGSRVLLIDADMRRPRLHGVFSMGDRPGLSNFLAGKGKLSDVAYVTEMPGLWVVPCGPIPPNPSELITSKRFRESVAAMRQNFEYIIIDSPPLNNVSDARVLATLVDGIVLVIRALSTSRTLVSRALEYLDMERTHILGVVLNDYNVKAKGKYYDYASYTEKVYGAQYGKEGRSDVKLVGKKKAHKRKLS